MNQTVPAVAAKLPKSEDLYDAISSVESVVQHLNELLSRVESAPSGSPEDKMDSPLSSSVASVLSDGPEVLRSKTSRIHNQINELENLLF